MPDFREVPDEIAATGALRLGTAGGILYWLSYSVPVGIGLVAVAVVTATLGPGGTSDLPGSAALATGFWIGGWIFQLVAYLSLCRALRCSTHSMRIGLLGVEALPRMWSAPRAMLVAVGTVIPLLVLGMLYRWIEGGFQVPELAPAEQSVLTPPSVGMKSHESIWFTAAWLCWVQAVLQMIPFPRTPGRQLVASIVVWVTQGVPEPIQRRLFQKTIVALSIVLVAMTFPLMSSDDPTWESSWPWVLIAGVLLWASSRSGDVIPLVGGMQDVGHNPDVDDDDASIGFISRWWSRLEGWRHQRRLQRALVRERIEAVDAGRVDEILNRLHRDGLEALSSEDRKLLDRVSQNLRRQREGNHGTE